MSGDFAFRLGKGLLIDHQREMVAYHGLQATFQPRHKPGCYRPTRRLPLRRFGWFRPTRKWDTYLNMRTRIGHGHHRGLHKKDLGFVHHHVEYWTVARAPQAPDETQKITEEKDVPATAGR